MMDTADRLMHTGALSALSRQARRNARLQNQVRAALDADLAAVTWVAGMRGGTLSLLVPGAAWATRLRFAINELQTRLSGLADFSALTSVVVSVAPQACPAPRQHLLPPARRPDPATADDIRRFAEDVDDAALRAALEHLAGRLRD